MKSKINLLAVNCSVVVLLYSAFSAIGHPQSQQGKQAQDVLTLDATNQITRPPRGRGPFPGSAVPGHSDGFPIRLDLGFLRSDIPQYDSALLDYTITNIGVEPVKLPCSVVVFPTLSSSDRPDPDNGGTSILTLWITSDAIIDHYATDQETGRLFKISAVGISAELDGGSRDPQSFCTLNPGRSLRVHSRAGVALKTGTHSLTAHAVLELNSQGTSKLVATADSEPITTTLF